MDDQAIIKAGIIEIFKSNGYTDVSAMTQRDFEHIGEQIRLKSGTLISGTTIKRLAYGEFSRLPQIATLNAIANYFDYKNWQDYKASKTPKDLPSGFSNGINLKYLSITSVIVFTLVATALYFLSTTKNQTINADTSTFSFHKNTSNDIPNSVVFNYNVDDVQADSFFIQQSWDDNRRVKIYKGKYTLTDIYYEPGYHIAKLIANDTVIRVADVSIPTDRWFIYAIDNIANYIPEYIKSNGVMNNGHLGITTKELQENNIDITKDKRYHYVYFPTDLKVPSDNFRFKASVRMSEVSNSLCPYIEIELFCQRSFMIMRSTKKGCAHEASIQFGNKVMRGNDTDLSPISFDVEQWTDIEITVKDKLASVKINDTEVFSTQFTMNTRLLTGLGFISNGLCEVSKVELTGLDGQEMGIRNLSK